MIESNEKFLSKFQEYISKLYQFCSLQIDETIDLSSLINRTGKTYKNNEWLNDNVLDLSTMPNDSIFINNFSNGNDFKTNIKSINNFDLVYGSIRPYFKKAGFALDINYIAGTVFSFNVKNKNLYLWILATICSNDFHKFTAKNSQGTKMPIINWDTFTTYKVPYDEKIILEFNTKVKPLFDIVILKMRENRKLKEIKSKLLEKYF